MKSTTRPTRTRATYRRSDSADTTGAAIARQRRLKRNDDRAESSRKSAGSEPEPARPSRQASGREATVTERPDRTMVQRPGEEGGGQRSALCSSVRSALGPVHNDALRDALSRRLPRRSGGGPGTAQPRAKERGVAPHARGPPVFPSDVDSVSGSCARSAVFRPPIHATAVASAPNAALFEQPIGNKQLTGTTEFFVPYSVPNFDLDSITLCRTI